MKSLIPAMVTVLVACSGGSSGASDQPGRWLVFGSFDQAVAIDVATPPSRRDAGTEMSSVRWTRPAPGSDRRPDSWGVIYNRFDCANRLMISVGAAIHEGPGRDPRTLDGAGVGGGRPNAPVPTQGTSDLLFRAACGGTLPPPLFEAPSRAAAIERLVRGA